MPSPTDADENKATSSSDPTFNYQQPPVNDLMLVHRRQCCAVRYWEEGGLR